VITWTGLNVFAKVVLFDHNIWLLKCTCYIIKKLQNEDQKYHCQTLIEIDTPYSHNTYTLYTVPPTVLAWCLVQALP
jgi:hypothetical protein